jgi:hypothetical protein
MSINASMLNKSMRPRRRSLTRGCVTRSTFAASACLSRLDVIAFAPESTGQHGPWTELATAYADQHAERSIELAGLMLEHFREEGTIVGAFRSQTNKVLEQILRRFRRSCGNALYRDLAERLALRALAEDAAEQVAEASARGQRR